MPDRARAEPLLREQVTLAEAWGEQRLAALSALGTNAVLWGARVEARRLLETCRDLHDATSATNHYDAGLAALVYLAIVLRELGRTDEAREIRREVEALARRAQPFNRCLTAVQLAMMALLRDDPADAATHLETATADAERHGFDALAMRAAVLRSAADALVDGRPPDASVDAMELGRRHGTMSSTSPYRLLLAEAWGRAAEPARALAVADEALAFVVATGEAEYAAELHRVRGEQLHALGDREAAVGALRTALDVAQRGKARLHTARAALGLRALDPAAGDDALQAALPGLVLDVDEPDLVRLRDVVAKMPPD